MCSILKQLSTLYFIIRDQMPLRYSVSISKFESVTRAMSWLCQAQDVTNYGGVATGYDLRSGWLPPFPETTGYIIPTFFNYYHITNKEVYQERAIRMLDWLIEIQNKDGSISGIIENARHPLVFDTGQVIFGLVCGYRETGTDLYQHAARKAGEWLVRNQDEDGKWSRCVFQGIPHAYHTRVSWALIELNHICPNQDFIMSAEKNCNWVLSHQLKNGWFDQNYFSIEEPIFTHMIAYTTRGLLEIGYQTQYQNYINSAKQVADVVLHMLNEDGSIPGSFNEKWKPTTRSSCLTGNAQFSIIWSRLFEITNDEKYIFAAQKVNQFLMRTQEFNPMFKKIYGAIKGSHPINGNYLAYVYPNWATKFFADAIMLEYKLIRG